jgi:hypothetical protein
MPIFTTGPNPEMADDQSADDARSLTFDSAPLTAPIELLGAPVLALNVSADARLATVVARLCDVAPDGASRRITFGALNLAHRHGVDRPAPLEPGERYHVELRLYETAYRLPPGHRLRLALSTGYWPMIWPSPASAEVTLHTGASRLSLPVLRSSRDAAVIMPPETAAPVALETMRLARYDRRESANDGERRLEIREDFGASRYGDIDIDTDEVSLRVSRLDPRDPASAAVEAETTWSLARGAWRVGGSAHTTVSGSADAFEIRTRLEAREGDSRIFERSWSTRVPRRFV